MKKESTSTIDEKRGVKRRNSQDLTLVSRHFPPCPLIANIVVVVLWVLLLLWRTDLLRQTTLLTGNGNGTHS
jgi:hypothetical protein